MGGWLQKILTPLTQTQQKRSVPAPTRQGNLPAQGLRPSPATPQSLPNATVIYGIGASLLFVASFFLLLAGRWFSSFAVFVLGVCLTGFALHLLKHQD